MIRVRAAAVRSTSSAAAESKFAKSVVNRAAAEINQPQIAQIMM